MNYQNSSNIADTVRRAGPDADRQPLALGPVDLELVVEDERFFGLGRIAVAGCDLRSGRLPMFAHLRTPDGLEMGDWRLEELREEADTIELTCTPAVRSVGLMEWMVHETRNRLRVDDWSAPTRRAGDTAVRLELQPRTRQVGGFAGEGLSYRYRYRSESMPIYRMLDRGSWEPGGECVGCSLWQRTGVPPIKRFASRDDAYSSEWRLPKAGNPHVFQFQPWQTHLQGFTFTAADQGVLVTWATRAAHIRTLLEKPTGWAELLHLHEHCQDLSGAWSSSPVEVLWFEGVTEHVDRINLYEAVRDHVHETLHEQVGMRRDRVTTYGMMEEWGNADLQRYAERGVPKLLDAGVRTIGLANHLANNMNTFGIENMCCTYDLRVAESVGEEQLQTLCEQVKAGGGRCEMWANTSLSTMALLLDKRNGEPGRIDLPDREGSVMEALDEADDPFVRTPSDAIEADHYTPRFAVMNLRDPVVRSSWLRYWKDLHDRIGIDDFFLDSSFNLSSDKFHWIGNTNRNGEHGGTIDQVDKRGRRLTRHDPKPAILSEYRAHLELVAEMQKLGYRYNAEDLGVFGISRTGPRVCDRLDNLFLWPECLAEFDVPSIEAAGADPDDVFFRGLAYRMMWMLFWPPAKDELSFRHAGNRDERDRPSAWHVSLFKAFDEVNDLMRHRYVLPEERGVIYHPREEQQVLWAFQDFEMELRREMRIRSILTDNNNTGRAFPAQQYHVYVITPPMKGTDG